ncbi:MAG: hypothetical protein QW085_06345 [Pyrobaculum sp.]
MACVERDHLPAIRYLLKCGEGVAIDLGFMSVKPDLMCRDVPTEVECVERVHLGLGQALAYKYALGKSALVVIADEASGELKKFLKWASEAAGIDVYLYINGVFITL